MLCMLHLLAHRCGPCGLDRPGTTQLAVCKRPQPAAIFYLLPSASPGWPLPWMAAPGPGPGPAPGPEVEDLDAEQLAALLEAGNIRLWLQTAVRYVSRQGSAWRQELQHALFKWLNPSMTDHHRTFLAKLADQQALTGEVLLTRRAWRCEPGAAAELAGHDLRRARAAVDDALRELRLAQRQLADALEQEPTDAAQVQALRVIEAAAYNGHAAAVEGLADADQHHLEMEDAFDEWLMWRREADWTLGGNVQPGSSVDHPTAIGHRWCGYKRVIPVLPEHDCVLGCLLHLTVGCVFPIASNQAARWRLCRQ